MTAHDLDRINARHRATTPKTPFGPNAPAHPLGRSKTASRKPKGAIANRDDYLAPDVHPTVSAGARAAFNEEPPAGRFTWFADWIFGCLSTGATTGYVEAQIGVPIGSLSGWLFEDSARVMRLALALNDAATAQDKQARAVLAAIKGGKGRVDIENRALANLANTLRATAEGNRRLSEGVLRKAAAIHQAKSIREDAANGRGRHTRHRRMWLQTTANFGREAQRLGQQDPAAVNPAVETPAMTKFREAVQRAKEKMGMPQT